MPLDRAHVTRASRIMLPVYVVLFAFVGSVYLLTPGARLLISPGLAYASGIVPLDVWGWLFLSAALIMLAALLSHRRTLYRFGLWVCIVCMALWASVLALAAVHAQTSWSAWAWPAFVATACFASDRSLLAGEVD